VNYVFLFIRGLGKSVFSVPGCLLLTGVYTCMLRDRIFKFCYPASKDCCCDWLKIIRTMHVKLPTFRLLFSRFRGAVSAVRIF